MGIRSHTSLTSPIATILGREERRKEKFEKKPQTHPNLRVELY
jgi:hypothetical protein